MEEGDARVEWVEKRVRHLLPSLKSGVFIKSFASDDTQCVAAQRRAARGPAQRPHVL